MSHASPARPAARPFDPDRHAAFAERFAERMSGAGVLVLISIAHRTGLFDALAGAPATSEELARRAGLEERYVRECLGGLLTGGVVELDPATRRYALPPEHAAWLTRRASPDNLAVAAQWVAVMGAAEDGIVDCFVRGGGLPYSAYARFHEVMAEQSAETVVASLETRILPLEPRLVPRLERGARVLDVGCGAGRALVHLARRFPKSSFVGVDLCADAIETARAAAASRKLSNVRFEAADVFEHLAGAHYDLICAFDAIHDQAKPDAVLARIADALGDDGVFLMQEIRCESAPEANVANPFAPFLYAISCLHCTSVSLARHGAGLGATWGRTRITAALHTAGFTHIRRHELDHDPLNDYYVAQR